MQDRPSAPIDFDELERQLAAQVSPKRSGNDDPLAELARVVGHDDLAGGAAGRMAASDGRLSQSFDDLLRSAPGPAANAGEKLLPLTDAPFVPHYGAEGIPLATHPQSPAPDQAFDDLFVSPQTTKDAALPTSYEAALAELGLGSAVRPGAEAVMNEHYRDAPAPDSHETFADLDLQPESPGAGPVAVNASRAPAGGFDDMLAEFEAAMRDAGAERAAAPLPPIAPVAVPLPPAEPQSYGSATTLAAAAGAAGAIAAGAAVARPARSRRGLMLAAGVVGVAVIGVASLLALGTGPKTSGKDAPVIAAKPGAMKERPVNPGGIDMPNQDKEVLQQRATDTAKTERVAPREEQPLDLTQAQRTAEGQAPNGVRQIPGVSLIAPTQTGGSPAQAVPRPVASVPITIAGQPPVAAPSPSVAPAAGPPSLVVPPQVSGFTPPPAQAGLSSTPPPVVTPQAAAPQTPPSATATPPATAEPRRVRAVPIRPDEAAPSRAQAQPRVVPTNPRAATDTVATAENDDATGPLRITPQVARPAAPRVAAVLPPSAVPTSTSSQPATTQTAPVAPVTSGSGFSVQLAAEGSEEAARSKFNRMRSQHSDVLGSLSPVIRNAEVNGRSIYRLRVGNMAREEAVSLCERLKAEGGSCFVVRD